MKSEAIFEHDDYDCQIVWDIQIEVDVCLSHGELHKVQLE
jgi:hypothetical protein